MQILLIEDDLQIGRGVMCSLELEGATVIWVRQMADATEQASSRQLDAIILDLSLPDGDGLDWLASMRARDMSTPVLIISAREGLQPRLRGLEGGADDYLVKPFAFEELLARLRVVLRRSRQYRPAELSCGGLTLDPSGMSATLHARSLELSRTEFLILVALMKRTGRVVTRTQLESAALSSPGGNSLDMHMSNIRKKIGMGFIRTVRGVGYVLHEES